jgi:hypothetical protein
LIKSLPGRARYHTRTRRRPQLSEKLGDGLGHGAMGDRELGGFLPIILLLRAQLPQPNLLSLRNGGLRDETAKHHLPGRIDPMPRQGSNYVPPDPLLERIQIRRRLRTTLARNQGHNGKAGGGLTGHTNEPLRLPW